MQHNTGVNPSEPTDNDVKASAWKFIIRGAFFPNVPEAFTPHCSYLAWISSPMGSTGKFLIRGYIQWRNRRNYYTVKHRYSRQAEWIPVQQAYQAAFDEFTTGFIPSNATRYISGVPIYKGGSTETPLQKVGYNITVPDLIEEYTDVLVAGELEPPEPLKPRDNKRKREEDYDAEIAAQMGQDFTWKNPYTGEELFGRQAGHNWYANKKK